MSTILVIDESAVCREPLAAILEARGHRVLRAAKAHEARALLSSVEPDLILMDLVMGAMEGLALLESIRGDQRHKHRPIILITACADRGTILAARALGVHGYILKASFSVDQMLDRVKACLEGTIPSSASPPAPAAA
jgi:DNA-binding NarL/FixJ family response regulator